MGENNLSSAIKDLFDDNGGGDWIVTKNEKGKVKVARCNKDALDDLYVTRTDWLVRNVEDKTNESTSQNVYKYQLYGTAMFFIKDLLSCELRNGHFVFKNVPFLDVFVCGTIVSLSIRFDKYAIVVDDNTSKITCLIKQEEFKALKLSEDQKEEDQKLLNALKADPTDQVIKGAVVVMQAAHNLDRKIPTFDDLQLGDIITIMGTLSDYNGNRYIFIKYIEKQQENSLYHITHLENLCDIYEEYFKNM